MEKSQLLSAVSTRMVAVLKERQEPNGEDDDDVARTAGTASFELRTNAVLICSVRLSLQKAVLDDGNEAG